MKFNYVSMYQIWGLTHNAAEDDISMPIKGGQNSSLKAILTGNPDKYCDDLDRSLALGYIMLKGMAGQHEADAVKLEIDRIRESRKKTLEGTVALFFVAEGNAEADLSRPSREVDDYVVGFEVIDKEKVVSTYKDQINATVAALCLSSDRIPIQIKKVRSDVYLINDQNKPVYSLDISMSGEAFSSTPITTEIINGANVQFKRSNKRQLSKVNRLLTQAISRDNDELRRFMFGWAGLEVLITSAFKDYEKVFVQSLQGANPTCAIDRYFKRIQKVMEGKYNIADMFVIVAACINNEPIDDDILRFVKIKKIRDALFHDTSASEKGLPTFEVIELLKKYLKLHTSVKR